MIYCVEPSYYTLLSHFEQKIIVHLCRIRKEYLLPPKMSGFYLISCHLQSFSAL
jgi:hypothetical protein